MSKISKIIISGDVIQVAITHAFTTEREEIAGVLIGDINGDICQVVSLMPLRRTDKRKDRVELSYEQLAEASQYCDNLSVTANRRVRVVGWYHSHPHITVWPSHVDIRTQWMYQGMDSGFVGLIVSVYSTEANSHRQRVALNCFQSTSETSQCEIAMDIIPGSGWAIDSTLKALVSLPDVFMAEEEHALAKASEHTQEDLMASCQNACAFANTSNRIMQCLSWPLLYNMQEYEAFLDEKKMKLLSEVAELEAKLVTNGTNSKKNVSSDIW